MPRYDYRCAHCETVSTLFHLIGETVSQCPKCEKEGQLTKLVSSFRTAPKKKQTRRVGAVTEEFIENAREELSQQQAELKKGR